MRQDRTRLRTLPLRDWRKARLARAVLAGRHAIVLPFVAVVLFCAATDDDDEEAVSDLGSSASTGPSRNASVASFDVDDQPPPGCAAVLWAT